MGCHIKAPHMVPVRGVVIVQGENFAEGANSNVLTEPAGSDPCFAQGLNTYRGYITNHAVAESLGMLPKLKAFSEP